MPPDEDDRYALADDERDAALRSLVGSASDGHLSLEEFFSRTDAVVAATSRAELVAATSQLQASPVPAAKPRRSWWVPFGNRIQRGRFVLPERTRALIWVGEIHLDLRGATIVGPMPTVRLWVFVGSLRVLVPRGMSVEVDQSSIAGGRRVDNFGPPPNPSHPTLRVRMLHFMGNVKVTDDPAAWSPAVAGRREQATSWVAAPLPPEATGKRSWPSDDG